MLTTAKAHELARQWVDSWNARDIGKILSHYSDDVVFSSPFVKAIAGGVTGSVLGRDELQKYFEAALVRFPSLHFYLRAGLLGVDTLTVLYNGVNGMLAAETMALNADGQICQVWAQYDQRD